MTAKQMQQKIAELERRIAVLEQTRPLVVAPQPYYWPQYIPPVTSPYPLPGPWWIAAQSYPKTAAASSFVATYDPSVPSTYTHHATNASNASYDGGIQ